MVEILDRESGVVRFVYHLPSLERADLRNENFETADLAGVSMPGAILCGGWLQHADLSGADLTGADLYWARLNGARLDHAILEGADCQQAKLLNVSLRDARLARANFSGAELLGADLSGADLSETVLTEAWANASTRWPEGFDARARGVVFAEEYEVPVGQWVAIPTPDLKRLGRPGGVPCRKL